MRLILVLGDSLYPTYHKFRKSLCFMAEDYGLCTHFQYHKHKLILFLSAMRSFADSLGQYHDVVYVPLTEKNKNQSYEDKLLAVVQEKKINEIVTYKIEDHFFNKRIKKFCLKNNIKLRIKRSPGFYLSVSEFRQYKKKRQRLLMQDFYIHMRKRYNLLLKKDLPVGGSWSYDAENRKPLPKDIVLPDHIKIEPTSHTQDVQKLVNTLFSNHIGDVNNFWYPTTREQSLFWFHEFLKHRLELFGPYEDAISQKDHILFHSVLSPILNLGLLTPKECVTMALEFAKKNEVSLPSIEGFIRQIIGWREFMRGMYHTQTMEYNYFSHTRVLSQKWYDGTTGLDPVDHAIHSVTQYGYSHHIERLMILGNAMLLCEIDPAQVYKWFMEFYVDSADWVMTPNVYGMSQYADGGSFATKPYISGSAYVCRMSDFPKGEWCDIWDALYWNFIHKHEDEFTKNPRMSLMVRQWHRKSSSQKESLLKTASDFLQTLDE